MASKAKIARNLQKQILINKYAAKRAELSAVVADPEADPEAKDAAMFALQKLPRDSSKTRYRNRCRVTGRPRGTYRKFQMSRIAVRELGLAGEIPGLTKSSW